MPRAASKTNPEATVVKLPVSRYARKLNDDPYAPATEEEMTAVAVHPSLVTETVEVEEGKTVEVVSSLASGPQHIGMRRVAALRGLVDKETPLDDPESEATSA